MVVKCAVMLFERLSASGTKPTCSSCRRLSAVEGRADMPFRLSHFCFRPISELSMSADFHLQQTPFGCRNVGPISLGLGRPGAGGCGWLVGGSKLPQSVRARICSTVC